MITKQAIERLKNFKAREKRRALPDDFNVYVEHQYNIDALDMAIEALSKQSGGEQANESVIVNFVAFQRKWLKAHKIMELNSADEVMTEIFLKETGKAFIDSLGQSGENDEADQFREATKKTEDVPDTNVEKMPYKKPEIIHCGDCRWYEKSHYCGANYPAPDDFCSWAERRNDG